MAEQKLTAADVHAQAHGLRARAEAAPERIELGQAQIAAIEADVQEAAGTRDIGPLVEFQGLPIVRSRKQDHVALLGPEREPVPEVVAVAPSGPEAEVTPSGG